jgi:adenylate cyclase
LSGLDFHISFPVALLILLIAVLVSVVGLTIYKTWIDSPTIGTPDPEAYENYLKGRTLWQNRSSQNLHKAMLLLEQAIQKDSNFALAQAALADAYAFDYQNWRKAEETVRQAIHLNPNLGEPHASIWFVKMFWEWKLKEAEEEFKQAIKLSPNYATGHQ